MLITQRKPVTKAQQWQRKRYRAIGTICAVSTLLEKVDSLGILTIQEVGLISECLANLATLKARWKCRNYISKRTYLHSKSY